MSEEKEAIERFKSKIKRADVDILKFSDVYTTSDIHNLRLLINLIEKQEQELNKEKEKNKKLEKQMGKDLDVIYLKGVYDERDKWKNKIKELAKKYEYAAIGYDSSEATFKQSQDIGRYVAYCNLLNKEEK